VRLRSGARVASVGAVDGLERSIESSVALEAEALVFDLNAFEIRSFRVRFGHA